MKLPPPLSAALSEALGAPIDGARPIGGGCINDAALITVAGAPRFLKWNAGGPAELFEREAAGLRAMRAAIDASGGGVTIPEVIAVGDRPGFLVLEYLPAIPRAPDFDEALGRGLAALHRAPHLYGGGYGFPVTTYCGTTPQPNTWGSDWITFYRDQRLAPLIERAARRGHLSVAEARTHRRLLERLDRLLASDDEPPALIHGDLWSGNLHVGAGGAPALIDPAVYYGHREAELGMMVLFGGFSRAVYEA